MDYFNSNSNDTWQGPSQDAGYQWDFNNMSSPRTMINQYNDLLDRAADFYATLDGNTENSSAGSGYSSYRSSPERRESAGSGIIAQVQKSIPDKIERRREQNRSSQRAYRERREKHQKELEGQINDWRHKHQALSQSYSQQTQEVQRLKAQIEQLTVEIGSLQNGLPNLYGTLNQSPTEFDLVPFFNYSATSK